MYNFNRALLQSDILTDSVIAFIRRNSFEMRLTYRDRVQGTSVNTGLKGDRRTVSPFERICNSQVENYVIKKIERVFLERKRYN